MTRDDEFIDSVRKCMQRRKGFEEKRMFGGTGFLLDGLMCCGIHKGRLILRLGVDAGDEALTQPHVKPFDITGKPMKGWVMINSRYLEDERVIRDWVSQAVEFVRMLPPKE